MNSQQTLFVMCPVGISRLRLVEKIIWANALTSPIYPKIAKNLFLAIIEKFGGFSDFFIDF